MVLAIAFSLFPSNIVYADEVYYRAHDAAKERKVIDPQGNTDSEWTLCINSDLQSPGATNKATGKYKKIENASENTHGDNGGKGDFRKIKRLLFYKLKNPNLKYAVLQNEYYFQQNGKKRFDTNYSHPELRVQKQKLRDFINSSTNDDEINKSMKITMYHSEIWNMQNLITATLIPKPGNDNKSDILEVEPPKATVNKVLEFAEGISVPGYTFNFTADKITQDAPNATIGSIKYTNAEAKGNATNGIHNVVKTSEVKFASAFPHAGLYEYTVTETQGSDKGITYSKKKYRLRVRVENNTDKSIYIKSITVVDTDTGEKPANLSFKNTYEKNGGENFKANQALVVEKQTVGELADKTKYFNFKLTLNKAKTAKDERIIGKIIRKSGEENVEFTYGKEVTFKLSDGEKLVFEKLPAGTRYNAVEVGKKDGYIPTMKVIENGREYTVNNEDDAAELTTATNDGKGSLVGENENRVTFINTYKEVSETGINTNNMPFIVLVGLSVSAFIVLAVAKKKKMSE